MSKKTHTLFTFNSGIDTHNLKNNGDNNSIKNNNNNNITLVPFSSGRLVEQWSIRCQLQKRGSLFNYCFTILYIINTFHKWPTNNEKCDTIEDGSNICHYPHDSSHLWTKFQKVNVKVKSYSKTCNRSKP